MAIPAYIDYLRRSKIIEEMNLRVGLKNPTEENSSSKGAFPSAVTILTTKTRGKYLTDMKIEASDATRQSIIYSIGF